MKSIKYQEVEAKFPLYNKDEVVEHIEKLGFKHIKKDKQQCDTYYSPQAGNFIQEKLFRSGSAFGKREMYSHLISSNGCQ